MCMYKKRNVIYWVRRQWEGQLIRLNKQQLRQNHVSFCCCLIHDDNDDDVIITIIIFSQEREALAMVEPENKDLIFFSDGVMTQLCDLGEKIEKKKFNDDFAKEVRLFRGQLQ